MSQNKLNNEELRYLIHLAHQYKEYQIGEKLTNQLKARYDEKDKQENTEYNTVVFLSKDGTEKKTKLSNAELQVAKELAKAVRKQLAATIEEYAEFREQLTNPLLAPTKKGKDGWSEITINDTEKIRVRRNETELEKAHREYTEVMRAAGRKIE